jgi:hypothetical protein
MFHDTVFNKYSFGTLMPWALSPSPIFLFSSGLILLRHFRFLSETRSPGQAALLKFGSLETKISNKNTRAHICIDEKQYWLEIWTFSCRGCLHSFIHTYIYIHAYKMKMRRPSDIGTTFLHSMDYCSSRRQRQLF